MAQRKLVWQSKLVLLLILPFTAASLVLQTRWWAVNATPVAIWTLGLSLLLGLVVLQLRAATPAAALTGFAITASLMFSTATFPYQPWRSALVPVLSVSLLAHFSTRMGRRQKERMGLAERHRGRSASQVAANLGIAVVVSNELVQSCFMRMPWLSTAVFGSATLFAVALAALAEAAADTVSSELGQVFGGRPRLITILRQVERGADGAVSLAGTFAGFTAAVIVAALGTFSLRGNWAMFLVATAGGVFGLLFDSLLGATLERRGWINNDLVNFLSTASAAAFALALAAVR